MDRVRRNRLSVFGHVRFEFIYKSPGLKICIRIQHYAVTSITNSVIYFGGWSVGGWSNDNVAEFKNLEWSLLGKLAGHRFHHRSIKMGNKIFLIGGVGTTYEFFI